MGNLAKIMRLIADGRLEVCYNSDILDEYKRVLAYDKFNFSVESQELAVENIKKIGDIINPSTSEITLPDESDRIFYDTAKAANAYLITGNLKHYPEESHILTPTQFVEMLEI
ncbi:MAG: putative toxin-antitoxin system toxin component, PIN family [Oscillospiraceae bacterium]|nr:putative toxin-antitoxin system toxin component, PIN family [Oscillospiraceae bacterium]